LGEEGFPFPGRQVCDQLVAVKVRLARSGRLLGLLALLRLHVRRLGRHKLLLRSLEVELIP
jgi:hypothetical protein